MYMNIYNYSHIIFTALKVITQKSLPGPYNPQPMGCMQPGMARKAAQHKIINLLKTV